MEESCIVAGLPLDLDGGMLDLKLVMEHLR
jgi:hypothetical protein